MSFIFLKFWLRGAWVDENFKNPSIWKVFDVTAIWTVNPTPCFLFSDWFANDISFKETPCVGILKTPGKRKTSNNRVEFLDNLQEREIPSRHTWSSSILELCSILQKIGFIVNLFCYEIINLTWHPIFYILASVYSKQKIGL